MTKTLGMYAASHAHIGDRLNALGLNLDVVCFDKSGMFDIDGAKQQPEDVELDYLWLSSHLNPDKAMPTAFDVARRLKRLDVLQTFNAGLDNPAYGDISAKGVRICNSSAQGVAIAEYVLGQVLAVLQPIELQRQKQADKAWGVTRFREISRTHWLIVGYGPIGEGVAKRAKAFGAKVSALRRSSTPADHADRTGLLKDGQTFAPDADIVVLACPLTEATRGFAGKAFFDALKPGAILVNIARGGVIDDPALIAAMDAGKVDRAILDVFHTEPLPADDPLWTHPKVRITPHTSFAGDGVQDRWDTLFLDNIQRYVKGETLLREVDPSDIA